MLSWSILQYFRSALSDYQSLKTIFGLLFEWPFKTGFTVFLISKLPLKFLWIPTCRYGPELKTGRWRLNASLQRALKRCVLSDSNLFKHWCYVYSWFKKKECWQLNSMQITQHANAKNLISEIMNHYTLYICNDCYSLVTKDFKDGIYI